MDFAVFALVWAGIVIVSMVIVSYLAVRWGREPFGWALLTAVLGPIAIVGLLGTRQSDVQRPKGFERVDGGGRGQGTSCIVAAVDASAAAERVARYITEMHARGTDVQLLAVLPHEFRARTTSTQETEHTAAVESMTGAARRILDEAGVQHRVTVGYGSPGAEIVRFGEEEQADLIVIGRRGAGLSKALLGSVSDHVVKHATRPVVVVD